MSTYLITLTPTGKFFFGGDMTFEVETKDKTYNEAYGSYIIESNKTPQQTTLLGMMRYLILSHDSVAFNGLNKTIQNHQKAKDLIGEQGFVSNETHQKNEYKLIKSISSCFLLKVDKEGKLYLDKNNNGISLLPVPKDDGYKISFNSELTSIVNSKKRKTPVLLGYDPKKWKEINYIGKKGRIKESDLFTADCRIGISKDYSGKSNDKAFFKQIAYRLGKKENNDRYRFAFFITVDNSLNLDNKPYNESIVSLGGDNSQFILNISKSTVSKIEYAENEVDKNNFDTEYKLILLSDSYLTREEALNCEYAITDLVPFRYLETTVKVKNYTILSEEVKRSKKSYLYQKGSVFYCNEIQLNTLKEALNKKEFVQIGYNDYQVIQKNK